MLRIMCLILEWMFLYVLNMDNIYKYIYIDFIVNVRYCEYLKKFRWYFDNKGKRYICYYLILDKI